MIFDLTLSTAMIIIGLAFIAEYIDSGLGMGYGTLLSPLLIIWGFSPISVVPSILITQAFGGLSASIFHHKYGNASFQLRSWNPFYIFQKIKEYGVKESFEKGFSEDLKTVIFITTFGIIATIIAAFAAIRVSTVFLNTYIGILVMLMGVVLLSGITFRYSTPKMYLVGIVSSFNKGFSGGGFGPVVTGGQMVLGQDHKKAISCTTAAEFPICIVGFLIYLFTDSISNWGLIISLGIGAMLAGVAGPRMTRTLDKKTLLLIVSLVMIILGVITLAKTYGFISLKISV